MISNIEIKNFQNHEHAKLDLDSGVNAIIGQTDSGKSAIVRALRWLVFNRPSGEAFKKNGQDSVSVKIETDKGIIERAKTKKKNSYSFGDKEWKAIGTEIPEEIIRALKLSELNFQTQFEGPFLLNKSAGAVAREINKVANLDKIDSTLANITSVLRKEKAEYTNQKTNLDSAQQEYETLIWVDSAEEFLDEIEKEQNNYLNLSQQIDKIKELVDKRDGLLKAKNKLDIIIIPANLKIDYIETKADAIEKSKVEYEKLLSLVNERKRLLKNKEKLSRTIKPAQEEIKNIESENNRIEKLYKKWESLSELFNSYEKEIKIKKELESSIIELEVELKEIMPDICPLCGQEVKVR